MLFVRFTVMSLLLTASIANATPICARLSQAVASGTPAQKLSKFLSEQWIYMMTESPEFATYTGFPGQNDRWSDYSLPTTMRHRKEELCILDTLKKIPANALKGQDRVSYDVMKLTLEERIEGHKFNREFMPISHLDGLQIEIADIISSMPTANKKDYENIIARLNKVPALEQQTEELLAEGLKLKTTGLKMHMNLVPAQIDRLLTEKLENSPFYAPFTEIKANISDEDKFTLRNNAQAAIREKVLPSLQRLKDYLVKTYIPACRESTAITSLPNGKDYYTYLIYKHTSSRMTPDELHTLGLNEVARILREMEVIKEQVKFRGTLKEFNTHLLKEKRFFYDSKEALIVGYRDIAKRIDPELPKLFKTLPRLTYGAKEMPGHKAAEAPAAYYSPGSPEAGRAGIFEVNTTDLSGRPKWAMEALTLHEAVPGHHLQIALGQELKDIPTFRKYIMFTAFVEGWGLYAESLGSELGMYKELYSRYGQLSFEIWRAIRLVVDTGLHAKGWSRDQAIDYFTQNMPKSRSEIEIEVDRYIHWPGQALAYKIGQLKFKELRERATKALGDKFDIREFHDQLLLRGALPMALVEKNIDEWIALQLKGAQTTQKK